ncbi:hypothetical protein [Niallia sp. FSL R7-0271]|uniref:hypothetical protein n=1 Tax=Niallia sp. FSL R7-0271 TaxID=2921678 RepID=UPI0030FCDC2F
MNEKDIWGMRSVILTAILVAAAFVIFILPRVFELGTVVLLYLLILVGFVVSFIFGLLSKKSFKVFSLIAKTVLLLGLGEE